MRESDGLRRIQTGERFRRAIRLALEAPKEKQPAEPDKWPDPILLGGGANDDAIDETPDFPELKSAGADTPDKVAKLLALGLEQDAIDSCPHPQCFHGLRAAPPTQEQLDEFARVRSKLRDFVKRSRAVREDLKHL